MRWFNAWFGRSASQVQVALPVFTSWEDRTHMSPSVHIGKGATVTIEAHQAGPMAPMGWVNIAVRDADSDFDTFDLNLHFENMDDYRRFRASLPQQILVEKINGMEATVLEDDDGDDAGA